MNSDFSITVRSTCRVCHQAGLIDLYSLGNLYISGFLKPGEEGIRAPLDMVLCPTCSLVQLRHTAPQELLYARYYWYRSGVTDSMRESLRDITQQIESMISLEQGDVVLDIGSNDGTLLRTWTAPGIVKVGVEPATNLAEEGRQGTDVFINDFWSRKSYESFVQSKARVITAIGMFYDMEDPNGFIRDAADVLRKDGLFVTQLMCLKNMLDTNDVGNICHEHLEYYSLKSLSYLFAANGMEMIDVQYTKVNGGSYRIFTRPIGGTAQALPGARERMQSYIDAERDINTVATHTAFFARIEVNKRKTVSFIRDEVGKGKSVWVYGASTKGNTILQYFGLDRSLITGASDRSPDKWGKVTVGTNIPIYPEDVARKANPDYFLVLPYAFLTEFLSREDAWIKRGGRFIVPLPEFRVIP